MPEKREYKVLSPIGTPDGVVKSGTARLTDEMAQRFLKMPEPPIAELGEEPEKDDGDNGAGGDTPLTIDAIVEVIGQLKPDDKDAWTKGNKPQTEALAKLLDKEISAAERDEAWKVFQERNAP